MFFDEIQLSRNSWHYKLQRWTWGEIHFQNFCPYFWLTIFSIIISPFTLIKKSVVWTYEKIFQILGKVFDLFCGLLFCTRDIIDDKICKPAFRKSISLMSDKEVLNLHNINRLGHYCYKGDFKSYQKNLYRFEMWKLMQGEEWKARLKEIETKAKEESKKRVEALKKLEKPKTNYKKQKARLTKIVNATQKYFKWVIFAVGAVALYFAAYLLIVLGELIYKLGLLVNWVKVGHVALIVLVVAGGIGAIALSALAFIFLLKTFIGKCDFTIFFAPVKWFFRKVFGFAAYPLRLVLTPIAMGTGKIASSVFGGLEFFVDYVKAVKNNNCPRINWDD